jgi:predicted secreted Zn-dependent protease
MTLQPLVRSTCTERTYVIAGSNARQLRAAIALLGPVRDGHRFGAYTDWEITWRFRRCASAITMVEVDLVACVTLPAWRPPRTAPRALVDEWRRYRSAMTAHERGHVALAEEAAHALAAALVQLADEARPFDPTLLDQRCREQAQTIFDHYRELERAYDVRSDHGARDGVALADT